MVSRRKTWMGIGLSVVAGGSALAALPALSAPPAALGVPGGSPAGTRPDLPPPARAGGEGGAKAAPQNSYILPGSTVVYDPFKEIAAYSRGVHASYAASLAEARKMQTAIAAFLAKPASATLAAARAAWVAARPSYLVTEVFRFYDGPIEAVEGELNSWPVNEAFIDYVKGAPDSGIINDQTIEISLVTLLVKNQVSDEADITLGWHAIEFLLWGQDLSATGPGNRPFTDYTPGKASNDRRRAYLEAATDRLVEDLGRLELAWRPGVADNYAATFAMLDPHEAVGRILTGLAVLTGSELMSERLAVGLDSGDQEDEHSCFSDTTHQDFVYDLKGVENVWTGKYPGAPGVGLRELVGRVDPVVAKEIDRQLADATAKVAALGSPWDQVLASKPGSPGRVKGEAAVTALGTLAQGLKRAGTKLGVLVQIP